MVNALYVLRGLPGSGKSFLATKIKQNNAWCNNYSTDNYWIRPDGVYDFNAKLIKQAHEWNFANFQEAFVKDVDSPNLVLVDNTNTTYWEIKRYVEYAVQQDSQIEIVLLEPATAWKFSPADCAKKNTHGVSEETIMRMLNRWEPSEKIAEQINNEFGVDVKVQIGE